MKVLVVYYSLQGNSKCIGDLLAAEMRADIEEIRTVDPVDPYSFMDQYRRDGEDRSREMVRIRTPKHNPADYDLMIIGTPVWAWAPAAPVIAYLQDLGVKGKKIALYTCSEGESGTTFERMEKLLKGNIILSKREFINPRKDINGMCGPMARDWAKDLLQLI